MTGLMGVLSILGGVALFWFMAVIVPGLDFLLVTRLAIRQGRAAALRASLGISTGIALWGLAGFFGIRALFAASPWLYLLLKIGGGLYLVITGFRLFLASWRGKDEREPSTGEEGQSRRAFHAGMMTNLANPKAPVFVSSLFAAVLPHHASASLGLGCVLVMFGISLLWFGLVTTILSLPRINRLFLRFRHWVDRCAGLAFMALGVHFATDRTAG